MIALPWIIATVCFCTLFAIKRLERSFMSEIQDAVDAVVTQLAKASEEIKAEIAALEAREPSVDLTALKAAAQTLDDIVPDAPAAPAEATMSPPSTSENYPSSGSQTIISDGPAVDMRDVELGQRWCVPCSKHHQAPGVGGAAQVVAGGSTGHEAWSIRID